MNDSNLLQTTGGSLTRAGYDEILSNICEVFSVSKEQIYDMTPLQRGYSNILLSFGLKGGKYVYRHPGLGSDDLIDRGRESLLQKTVEDIGVDRTTIAMSARSGWRISRYVNSREFNYFDTSDILRGVLLIRKLHDAPVKFRWEFDVLEKAEAIKDATPPDKYGVNSGLFNNFDILKKRCYALHGKTEVDSIKKTLSHGDCRNENFLINDMEIHLIDWEYGGYSDPGFDLGTYICGGDHTEKDVDRILFIYFGRTPTLEEKSHFYAYIAISGFFYMHWTMYKEAKGQIVGELKRRWHYYATKYSKLACDLYSVRIGDE